MSALYRLPGTLVSAILVGFVAAMLPADLLGHGHTHIQARFEVRDRNIEATFLIRMRDLKHMIDVDSDRNGRMSPEELSAARAPLGLYLDQALHLGIAAPHPAPCAQELVDYRLADIGGLQLSLRFSCPSPPEILELRSRIFAGTGHPYELEAEFISGTQRHLLYLDGRRNLARIELEGSRDTWLQITLFGGVGAGLLAAAIALYPRFRRRRNRS